MAVDARSRAEVASLFVQRRRDLGLTQAEAATRASLALRTWVTLEKNGSVAPASWRAAAVALAWPVLAGDDLLAGADPSAIEPISMDPTGLLTRDAALAGIESILSAAGLDDDAIYRALVILDRLFDLPSSDPFD